MCGWPVLNKGDGLTNYSDENEVFWNCANTVNFLQCKMFKVFMSVQAHTVKLIALILWLRNFSSFSNLAFLRWQGIRFNRRWQCLGLFEVILSQFCMLKTLLLDRQTIYIQPIKTQSMYSNVYTPVNTVCMYTVVLPFVVRVHFVTHASLSYKLVTYCT